MSGIDIVGCTLEEALEVYDKDDREKMIRMTFHPGSEGKGYYKRYIEDGVVVYEFESLE